MDEESLKSRVVMVVDDEEEVRATICSYLQKQQCQVFEAADGKEALETAADLPQLDLLIADVVMPHLDGPGLAEELLERRPGIKVLLISGYIAGPTVQRLVSQPDVDFLQKPFSFRALAAHASRLLRDADAGRARAARRQG